MKWTSSPSNFFYINSNELFGEEKRTHESGIIFKFIVSLLFHLYAFVFHFFHFFIHYTSNGWNNMRFIVMQPFQSKLKNNKFSTFCRKEVYTFCKRINTTLVHFSSVSFSPSVLLLQLSRQFKMYNVHRLNTSILASLSISLNVTLHICLSVANWCPIKVLHKMIKKWCMTWYMYIKYFSWIFQRQQKCTNKSINVDLLTVEKIRDIIKIISFYLIKSISYRKI